MSFPNLLTLDLAFNLLSKIDETVENLVKLINLKNLVLMGNPFCLLKPYKEYVLSQLKLLRYFDQEKVNLKENIKDKNSPKSPIKKAPSINTDYAKSQVSKILSLRNLLFFKGIHHQPVINKFYDVFIKYPNYGECCWCFIGKLYVS